MVVLSKAAEETADEEHDDGSQSRSAERAKVQVTGGHVAPAECTRKQATDERTGDTEDDRNDTAGRVAARNEKLGERACQQSQQDPIKPEGQRVSWTTSSPERPCAGARGSTVES